MASRSRFLLIALSAVAVSACGSAPKSGSTSGISPVQGRNSASGIVLQGPALQEHNGTLLAFLSSRVSGMTVEQGPGNCPEVHLRGKKSIFGSSTPLVYVDGARTVSVCVLDMLQTNNVSRVEIYPMGIANKPGYEAHPNGLILVFLRSGPSDFVENENQRRVVMRD